MTGYWMVVCSYGGSFLAFIFLNKLLGVRILLRYILIFLSEDYGIIISNVGVISKHGINNSEYYAFKY